MEQRVSKEQLEYLRQCKYRYILFSSLSVSNHLNYSSLCNEQISDTDRNRRINQTIAY